MYSVVETNKISWRRLRTRLELESALHNLEFGKSGVIVLRRAVDDGFAGFFKVWKGGDGAFWIRGTSRYKWLTPEMIYKLIDNIWKLRRKVDGYLLYREEVVRNA
ncbi:MAG: hypothetical protein QXN77_07835 [Candidatus Caldarchaeum sp.]